MIRGWLHEPNEPTGQGLVLTHGAGSNCESALLVAIAEEFTNVGFHVLRCDLAYRQKRPTGPPMKGDPELDREALREAAAFMRGLASTVLLGGHSYGGRQSTMLAADQPGTANALLLLSYPLHPLRKPDELRTAHFGQLTTPSLFIHGARDPFGSIAEMETALESIAGRHTLMPFEKTGHELKPELAPVILRETLAFLKV